jgi:hypothetical protein
MKVMQVISTSLRKIYLIHITEMVQEEIRLELVGLCKIYIYKTKQCRDIFIISLRNEGS